jgi:hypothetical protein
MTKEKYTLRTYPGGAAATALAYTVKLHVDDSTLASSTTDSAGQASYAPNLSPGPHYFTGTDTAPTPDAVRVVSSKSTGSGGAYSLAEIPMALRVLGNGVIDGYLNELAITDPDSGSNLSYATGAALIKGIPAVVNTSGTYVISGDVSPDASNPKACYLVLELTGIGQTEEGKVVMKAVCGTAAASPSLPSLTQTEATYQYPLASFTYGTSGSSNANRVTSLTDLRTFLPGRNPVVSSIVRRTDPTSEATTTSTTGADATSLTTTVTLVSGVVYDLQARCFLLTKISDAAQTAQVAAYLTSTSEISSYLTANSTSYVGLANAHSLGSVTGSGAAVSAGVRIKVSGGTMTYSVGMLEVIAVPRT